jgi:hypothetical protein
VLVGALLVTLLAVAAGVLVQRSGTAEADRPDAGSADRAATKEVSTRPAAADLLDSSQVRRLGPAHRWQEVRTDDNTSGDGLNSVCQQDRFADPDGYAAIVRSFRTEQPGRGAVQTVEVSRSPRQALNAFRTTLRWYAGCQVGRLQLLDAYRVDHVGDEADVLTLRIWKKPVTTLSVAVARTGSVTTSTVSTTVGRTPPDIRLVTRTLAGSVAKLCARTGAAGCVSTPTYRAVPPPRSGEEAGILAVADLPPVGRIARPWVGTRAGAVPADRTPNSCDRATFRRSGAVRARTRTYLIPQAKLPVRFGLTETYGVFRTRKSAERFLAGVRSSVAGCEDRDLAARVSAERRHTRATTPVDASSWDLTTELTSKETVRFRLGFVRVGRTVAELVFTPSPGDDMTQAAFDSLLTRAGDRLRELPH